MTNDEKHTALRNTSVTEEDELPLPWKRIQGAIWLAGLAILAWQGWWWPGILVLLAISGLFQAVVQLYLGRRESESQQATQAETLSQERAGWLPSVCPNCGGPISVASVRWTGPRSADCPYCNANLKPEQKND